MWISMIIECMKLVAKLSLYKMHEIKPFFFVFDKCWVHMKTSMICTTKLCACLLKKCENWKYLANVGLDTVTQHVSHQS